MVRAVLSRHGMVQLVVRLTPALGRVDDTLRALATIRMTAQVDSACLDTHVGIDAGEPDTCLYVEEWADRGPLARRMQSVSFRALLGLMETSVTSPQLEVRQVSLLGGLDYVSRACAQQAELAAGPAAARPAESGATEDPRDHEVSPAEETTAGR